MQVFRQTVIELIQGSSKQDGSGPEGRQGNGADEQDGGQDSQGSLGDHMNSFSFFRSVYRSATKSA